MDSPLYMHTYEVVFFFPHRSGAAIEAVVRLDAVSEDAAVALAQDSLGPGWKLLGSEKL